MNNMGSKYSHIDSPYPYILLGSNQMQKSNSRKIIALFAGAILSIIVLMAFLDYRQNRVHTFSFDEKINDCPYIFYEQDKVVIKWIEAGVLIEKSYYNDDFTRLKIESCEDFQSEFIKVRPETLIDHKRNFKTESKIAILSDVHGQYDLFIKLLKAHLIIDDQRNWSYDSGHFVVVGDIFDRGDKVTETLWFLYKLEQQAELSGGKVHFLLGNHEVMIMRGDLRYIDKKYTLVSEKMGVDYDQLFNENTLLGQWLRTKPVAISINDIAFSHAGFSQEFINRNFNIELTNKLFHEKIINQENHVIMNNDTLKFMIKSNGPIWYRGYFQGENFNKQEAQNILDAMKVKTIVVGHTSMSHVTSHYDGLIYSVDSSIKNGVHGELLIWKENNFFRGTLNGDLIKI